MAVAAGPDRSGIVSAGGYLRISQSTTRLPTRPTTGSCSTRWEAFAILHRRRSRTARSWRNAAAARDARGIAGELARRLAELRGVDDGRMHVTKERPRSLL